MRISFTIILNGIHHLVHNDYASKITEMVDKWVIVEGAAGNTGSTSWCKPIPPEYISDKFLSVDGTTGYIDLLSNKYKNIVIVRNNGKMWKSKDEMVNAALKNCGYSKGRLWEIDVDEQWEMEDIEDAEYFLGYMQGDTGLFLCDYYVGTGLKAVGDWGEGRKVPYRRLWKWNGQAFKTHEPPMLDGGNGREVLLQQRFKHYAYYFEKDVQFKNEYYSGHNDILSRWQTLQKRPIPDEGLHISELISGSWGRTDTRIVRI